MLMAYERFGEKAYLDAAVQLMRDTAERKDNPYYEVLGSYAPYIAARLNAEQNAGLPLGRMPDWVFTDGSNAARMDWGLMDSRWGEYDAYGLSGSLSDFSHGYAFCHEHICHRGGNRTRGTLCAGIFQSHRPVSAGCGGQQPNVFLADGLPPCPRMTGIMRTRRESAALCMRVSATAA